MNINICPQRSGKCLPVRDCATKRKKALSQKTNKHGGGRSQDSHILGVGWGWIATVMGYEEVFWDNILLLDVYPDYTAISSNVLHKNLLCSKIWYVHFL